MDAKDIIFDTTDDPFIYNVMENRVIYLMQDCPFTVLSNEHNTLYKHTWWMQHIIPVYVMA